MKLAVQEETGQDIENAGTESVHISPTHTHIYILQKLTTHDTKIMTTKHITM
jgi:hypothetical protein